MQKTRVIAISGHAESGKDTAARMIRRVLRENGYRAIIIHYADLLKFICTKYFGWNGEKDKRGRALLQYVGTDVVRKKNPNYWVDFIADMLDFFSFEWGSKWHYVIIPDTRFPNELERLKERKIETIHLRIERPDYVSGLTEEQKHHISETALNNVTPDYTIINDGSLDELRTKIIKWAKENLNAAR